MSFLGKGFDGTEEVRRAVSRMDAVLGAMNDSRSNDLPLNRVAFGETKREVCSNPECSSGWTMPWRSRRRPIFEGHWGCSADCVLALARAAVRRESTDRRSGCSEPHRHKVPLGLVMLAQGWITNPQLQAALQSQRAAGRGRIGDWLVSECGLGADQLTRGLSVQWGCPVLSVEGFLPSAMALVMPKQFVAEFGLVPLRLAGSRLLYLGSLDRLDASVAYAVEQMSGVRVESGLVEAGRLEFVRGRLMKEEGVPVSIQMAADGEALAELVTEVLERKQPLAARLVRLHQYYWLRLWLEAGTRGVAGSIPRSEEDMLDYVFSLGPSG